METYTHAQVADNITLLIRIYFSFKKTFKIGNVFTLSTIRIRYDFARLFCEIYVYFYTQNFPRTAAKNNTFVLSVFFFKYLM